MVKKTLLLIMLSFSLALGGVWVLRAQDPAKPKPETPKTEPQKPATTTEPQKPATATEQVDLSGTYAGTFNCEEVGLVGDTTLTISGNEFTTADGRKGRIIASKSSGYTAVALQISPADASGTATAKVISLRGKKSGNKLTLSPVAGSDMKCSFTTSKNIAKSPKTPAATGAEVANPTATPAQTPTPSPSPSPEPIPSPTPSGSPRPTPTPSPSPGEPTPTPTPSPSPSPSPSFRIG